MSSAEIQSAAPTQVGRDGNDPWLPLPAEAWNADAARHLLRRAGWTARPADIARAVQQGLPATLEELFPPVVATFPKSESIQKLEGDEPRIASELRNTVDEIGKRKLRKELRDRTQQIYQDFAVKWLEFASEPSHSSSEKWVLFLSDIYVVAFSKVKNPALLNQHFGILRQNAFGFAPALSKAISRSPAMIDYLDLRENKKDAPNENFARELFELFLLGEGNYSEADIKNSARAFTGYRHLFGSFHFAAQQHDFGTKHVFGHAGNFSGDEIIDLAYQQAAARIFLPRELIRFYLTDQPLPENLLRSLGDWWHGTGYDLRALAHRIFGSRLFFDASLRGNFIKSPFQFYLGLIQDLELNLTPLPRQVLGSLRQMDQIPFNPPNVRGWVGGRTWINSSTLSARRQLVQLLFSPINEAALNADELVELAAAEAEGRSHFRFDPRRLSEMQEMAEDEASERLIRDHLPVSPDSHYKTIVADFLRNSSSQVGRTDRLRTALVTLLQSPAYQLC